MRRIIFLVIACFAVSAEAEEVQFWSGYVDGNNWCQVSDIERMVYILGVIDGFYYSAVFGADREFLEDLHNCTETKPDAQLRAIVDKYHSAHPEFWDKPMSRIIREAFSDICSVLKAYF